MRIIRHIEEKELPDLLQQSENLKGIFKSKERKEVERQIEIAQNRVLRSEILSGQRQLPDTDIKIYSPL